MQIDSALRTDMLSLVKTSILDGYSGHVPSKTIKFYSNTPGTPLCVVEFSDLELDVVGQKVSYKFKSSDGSTTLRASVLAQGIVSYFVIDGILPNLTAVEQMLIGTVGGLSSTADIRFNSLDWSIDSNLTMTDLSLVMLQGA
jgi:hypothetical protein